MTEPQPAGAGLCPNTATILPRPIAAMRWDRSGAMKSRVPGRFRQFYQLRCRYCRGTFRCRRDAEILRNAGRIVWKKLG